MYFVDRYVSAWLLFSIVSCFDSLLTVSVVLVDMVVNSGAQEGRVISVDARETDTGYVSAENIGLPPQPPFVVPELSPQRQNLEEPVLEQVPTQLEMSALLREMQTRLKSTEDALVEFKKELVGRSGLKREADSPSGPFKKLKGSTLGKNVSSSREARWCGKCKNKHSSECSASTRKCLNCRKLGHISRECKEDLRCYNCQGMGHISAACPNK